MRPFTWKFGLPALIVGGALMLAPAAAYAHGFGPRYDLPVPLSLFVLAAGLAVGLSFVIIAVFLRSGRAAADYPRFNLLGTRVGRMVASSPVLWALRLFGLIALLAVIIAGYAGTRTPSDNLAPTAVWVLWWVGIAYASALVGNVWALINPWKALYELVERAYQLIEPGVRLSMNMRYPASWSKWPAVGGFVIFAWLETSYANSSSPEALATLASLYTLVTLAGMFVFGKNTWLENGETFHFVFGLLARFSPIELRAKDRRACRRCDGTCVDTSDACVDCHTCFERSRPDLRELSLRPYATGLLRSEGTRRSEMVLVLMLLATVSFDGLRETPAYGTYFSALQPGFQGAFGTNGDTAVNSLALAGALAVFAAVYWAFAHFIAFNSGEEHPVPLVARRFVFSLAPIAIAYHLAHFFSFLAIQGQAVIPLLSDPLGKRWDLLGTAGYVPSVGVVDARTTWFFSIAAIVTGHVIAVYLAHIAAMRLFSTHRAAVASQYPMLILMVGYTMASLWIIAQPITEVG